MAKPRTLQSAEYVEARFPGFTCVAGPYGVNFVDCNLRRHERALCVRSFRDQRKACPEAKLVMHGPKAWIIRKLPLELDNGKRNKLEVAGNFGICAGRMAGV